MLLGLYVLKSILVEKNLDALNNLNKTYLIEEDELRTYNRIIDYITNYGTLPPEDFIDVELNNYPLQYWIDELETRYKHYIIGRINSITTNYSDPTKTLEIVRNIIQTGDSEGAKIFTGTQLLNIVEEDIRKTREQILRTGLVGIPSGWRSLDEATGGYTKGDVFIFSARAKVGKTMLMCFSINKILSKGYKVMLISMEMTKEQILRRLISLAAKIPYESFRNAMCSFAELKVKETVDKIKNQLYILEGHLDKSISFISSIISGIKPDIVFIDGAYLIKPKRERQIWEEITEVVSSIKKLALQQDIPIVCSYQLRRMSSTKENLGLEHIALADTIGQIASCVIGIIEPEIPNQRKIEVIALREGKPKDFFIFWDWETMNFEEIGGFYEEENDKDSTDFDPLLQFEEDN